MIFGLETIFFSKICLNSDKKLPNIAAKANLNQKNPISSEPINHFLMEKLVRFWFRFLIAQLINGNTCPALKCILIKGNKNMEIKKISE